MKVFLTKCWQPLIILEYSTFCMKMSITNIQENGEKWGGVTTYGISYKKESGGGKIPIEIFGTVTQFQF